MQTQRRDDVPRSESDERIDELLLAWEDSLAIGIYLSATDLCRDCPELTEQLDREITRLKAVDRFIFPRHFLADTSQSFPTIPGYDILQEIGRGGMGIVYRARQLSLGRFVAIKTLDLNRLKHNDFVVRMRHEAKALSQMNHPNIVKVYDVVETQTAVSLVLEYIDGETLAKKLDGKPMPLIEAAKIALTLGRTLAAVHDRGLLHRDIKPANVLIDAKGQVKLADFGLVKMDGISQGVTLAGELIGSPNYMAPEQAEGRSGDVDARTDLYALGTTLYEMLTGRPPFIGTSAIDILDQVRHRDPVSLRQIIPGTPRDLETICHKCLEKQSSRRFKSASELSEELERFLEGRPIRSRPVGGWDRCWRWCKRHPGAAANTAIATIIFGVLFISNHQNLARYNRILENYNEQLVRTAENANRMRKIAEKHERQAKISLYAADIGHAASAFRQSDTRELVEALDRHLPGHDLWDQRGFEWWYLRRQVSVDRRVLLEVGSPVYLVRFSPDRKVMASAGRDAIVRLFDPETGKKQKEFPTGQIEVNGLAFSPDGTEIATTGDDGSVCIWNIKTGSMRIKFKANPKKAFQVLYVRNGQQLICCGTDPLIRAFDTVTGDLSYQFEGHRDTVESLDIIDEGATLISTSDDHTVKMWDLETRTEIRSFDSLCGAGPIAVIPERRLLIVGNSSGSIQTFDLDNGREVDVGKHLDRMGSLSIHPNGNLLAAGDSSGQIRLRKIDCEGDFTQDSYQPWQAHKGNVHSLIWSPDGSRLFSTGDDGRVLSWSLTAAQRSGPKSFELDRGVDFHLVPNQNRFLISDLAELRISLWDWALGKSIWTSPQSNLVIAGVSTDGKYFAGIAAENTLQLFATPHDQGQLSDGQPLATWQPGGQLSGIRFSPNGDKIAVSRWLQNENTTSDDHRIWLLNLPGLTGEASISITDAKASAFSPDGSNMALVSESGLSLWRFADQKIVWQSPQPDANLVEFSPDGHLIATDSLSRTVLLRSAVNGVTISRLANHRAQILGMAFSPDSRLLATSATDGTVKIWHVELGQELIEFQMRGNVGRLGFSADGTQLICHQHADSESSQDSIVVFDGSPFKL